MKELLAGTRYRAPPPSTVLTLPTSANADAFIATCAVHILRAEPAKYAGGSASLYGTVARCPPLRGGVRQGLPRHDDCVRHRPCGRGQRGRREGAPGAHQWRGQEAARPHIDLAKGREAVAFGGRRECVFHGQRQECGAHEATQVGSCGTDYRTTPSKAAGATGLLVSA